MTPFGDPDSATGSLSARRSPQEKRLAIYALGGLPTAQAWESVQMVFSDFDRKIEDFRLASGECRAGYG